MKKAILTILTGLSISVSIGQNFVYTPEQHRVDTVIYENFEAYDINITTPVPEGITFKWRMISNTFPAAWSYSLCDFGSCYVGIPSTVETMTYISQSAAQGGTVGFLKINLTCGYNYGNGKVVFYVYDSNDSNRGDTISFDVRWPDPLAVNEITENASEFSAYPNPAKNTITLTNSSDEDMNVSFSNIIGESVLNLSLTKNGSLNLDIAELPKGTYFVSFENGDKREVKKIIIQ